MECACKRLARHTFLPNVTAGPRSSEHGGFNPQHSARHGVCGRAPGFSEHSVGTRRLSQKTSQRWTWFGRPNMCQAAQSDSASSSDSAEWKSTDPYRVLNVPEDSDAETIKTAYRTLVSGSHFDWWWWIVNFILLAMLKSLPTLLVVGASLSWASQVLCLLLHVQITTSCPRNCCRR
jgi:hypothetical protein